MKVKHIISLLLIAVLIIISGCKEEAFYDIEVDNLGSEQMMSFTILMPDGNSDLSNTRIALEQKELNINLTWEEGDLIKLCFVQEGNSYMGTTSASSISNDGRSAEFTFSIPDAIKEGSFDLYGVYGGQGLSPEDATISILPDNSGNGSLSSIEESKDVMLYFASKEIQLNNPVVNVTLAHLGSLFSVTLLNSGETAITNLAELNILSDASHTGWAYNNENGGGGFDLVNGVFLNTTSAGNKISFKAENSTVESGETVTFWGWYPILPDIVWPELSLEMKDTFGNIISTSVNNKPARSESTKTGKAYYFNAEWNGTQLSFTDSESSDIYFVKPDGNDTNNGKSWDDAFSSIAMAISEAKDGDEIRVASGVYKESGLNYEKKYLSFLGGFNEVTNEQDYSENGKSTIDVELSGRSMSISESDGVIIDNFRFINGKISGSGGAVILNNVKNNSITNSIFENNENHAKYGEGGAVVVHGGGATTFVNCLFRGNKAERHGGAIAVWNYCTANIINCTFTGNTTADAVSTSGAIFVKGTDVSNAAVVNIYNSILWENFSGTGKGNEIGANYATNVFGEINLSNNIIKGGEEGILIGEGPLATINSSILDAADTDPLFVTDYFPFDSRLSTGSPAIDAGNNLLVPEYITYDLDGNPRIVGVAVDLGAFETN